MSNTPPAPTPQKRLAELERSLRWNSRELDVAAGLKPGFHSTQLLEP